jgi:hypothetical protein
MLGQSRWLGRIYGELTTAVLSRKPVIYFGTFGRGLFQSMYEPPSSLLAYLPFTLEWNMIAVLLFLAGLVSPSMLPIAVVPLVVSLAWAAGTAANARVDPRFGGLAARGLIAMLTYLGPLMRGMQRYLWRARGHADIEQIGVPEHRAPSRIDWRRLGYVLRYWSGQGHEKEGLLGGLMEFLIPRKYLIAMDPGWNPWDLEIYRGIWTKARVAVAKENHGGPNGVLCARVDIRLTRVSQLAMGGFGLAALCGIAFGVPEVAGVGVALGVVNLAVIIAESFRLARILNDALDIVARSIALKPMHGEVSATEPTTQQAA